MAYQFNGTNQSLTIGGDSGMQFGTADFAIAFQAYRATANLHGYIDFRNAAAIEARPTIYFNSGSLQYYTNGADRITDSGMPVNSWAPIALVRSGTETKLYRDGAQVGSTYTDSANYLSPTTLRIGALVDGFSLNGVLADVAFWKGSALTAAEVSALAKGFTAVQVKPQGLELYLPLIRDLRDLRGGRTITNVNSATVAVHPRIIT